MTEKTPPAAPPTVSRRRVVGKHLFWVLFDGVILLATFTWMSWFKVGGIYLPLALALLLRVTWIREGKIGAFVYFFVLFFLGDTYFGMLFPLMCAWLPAVFVSLGVLLGALYLTYRFNRFSIRWSVYCLLPALFVSMIFLSEANKPHSAEDCAVIHDDPRLEVLADLSIQEEARGVARFVVERPAQNDLLIAYRQTFATMDVHADRLDLETGILWPIRMPEYYEVIGLHYDDEIQRILAVVVDGRTMTEVITEPKKVLVFTNLLILEREIAIPQLEYSDYSAFMFRLGNDIVIQTEMTYLLDRTTWEIREAEAFHYPNRATVQCRVAAEVGFLQITEDEFVISGGGMPMLTTLVARNAACRYNVRNGDTKTYRAGLGQALDVAYAPDRKELYLSSLYRTLVWVVDSETLEHKRAITVGACPRPMAYDTKRGVGYTVESYTGDLLTFDVEDGRTLDRRFVGRSSRRIQYSENLGPLVLSGCGIFRLLPPGETKDG